MKFLRGRSPLVARSGGGVILFVMLLFGIPEHHDTMELWVAFAISILMILIGWMIPSSGSQRKDAGRSSGSGDAVS